MEEVAGEVVGEELGDAVDGLTDCYTSYYGNPNHDQNCWQTLTVEEEAQQTQTHHLHPLKELGEGEPSNLIHLLLQLKDV